MNSVLYRIVNWGLSVLPVDPAGRRVFDETLADWRRELDKAHSVWARTMVSIRATWSVLRSVGGVTVRELGAISGSGVLGRLFFWISAYLGVVYLMFWPLLTSVAWLYYLVAGVAFILPVALMLSTLFVTRRRPMPVLGLSFAAVAIAVVLLGWGVPFANRAFWDGNPFEVSSHERSKPGEGFNLMVATDARRSPWLIWPATPFLNDLTVPNLVTRISEGPLVGWSAIRWLSFYFAYLGSCALVPIIGMELSQCKRLSRYAVGAVTLILLFTQANLWLLFDRFSVVGWLGAYWIPVAWMTLCIAVTGRRSMLVSEPIAINQ
jgi:hypothetical protein